MKTKLYVGALVAACVLLGSCKRSACKCEEGASQEAVDSASVQSASERVGCCGDGTSMNALELIQGADTLYISMVEARDSDRVFGGFEVGDSVYVLLNDSLDVDGNMAAHVVVNLSELVGSWRGTCGSHTDCSYIFGADHSVVLDGGAGDAFSSWSVKSGGLVLSFSDSSSSDSSEDACKKKAASEKTFTFQLLDCDSLILKGENEEWKLGR